VGGAGARDWEGNPHAELATFRNSIRTRDATNKGERRSKGSRYLTPGVQKREPVTRNAAKEPIIHSTAKSRMASKKEQSLGKSEDQLLAV